MQAVFIRHNMAGTRENLEDLWAKRIIAIHYADIPSLDPEAYRKPGKAALTRLHKYCAAGAIVGASYRLIRPAKMLVGEIQSGSKVFLTSYGDLIYKAVQLSNAIEVSYADYPLLAAIQPRQGAVTGWPSAQKYLAAILGREPIPWSVDSLAPSQLEVICYEYLRVSNILKALCLRIGRTLPDVDIYGIDENGQNVIAQVTHSNKPAVAQRKVDTLREYQSPGTKLILFGPERSRVADAAVEYVAIEAVFDLLSRPGIGPVYPKLISKMLLRDT